MTVLHCVCFVVFVIDVRSPNGPGLTKWPEYGAEAEYLGIGLEQKPGKNFKGQHFNFMTQKLPQIIKEWNEGKLSISEFKKKMS